MVTRNIEKNTASQVNSDKIGVLVHQGGTPDPVECTVSYSVDGVTFTQHPTVLTDENNVICNIPRYIYLKFSQDVTITEE